ncbi:hypothetical protein DM02DRAFT_676360 [Periconia macrospinosa]|uniref:Mid2 domain-containing protein n=1 Tax=Periconia macrospinosa TaxID=97972 RepID=A0A2V1D820_9PLEO|nr:hypothetical protein DM02DRAFT_676360 [Periconia macrospinosa]
MTTPPFSMLTISFFFLSSLLAPVKSQSENVCSYQGGWALRVQDRTCPIDAPVNCGVGAQLRCCANGLVCAGEGDYGGNYCCKEGEDCRKNAEAKPQCPDPKWTLWGGNGTLDKGGWCCEPGFNGFYRGNMEAVGCTSAGVRTLPTSLSFASTIRTVACVQTTSSSSLSNAPSTSSTPSPTGAGESNNSSSSSPSPSPSPSSISGAAIAGIVVGAIGGVVLVAFLVAFVLRRKKQKVKAKNGDHINGTPADPSQYGNYYEETAKPPVVQYGSHAQNTAHELSSQNVFEIDDGQASTASHKAPRQKPQEMP